MASGCWPWSVDRGGNLVVGRVRLGLQGELKESTRIVLLCFARARGRAKAKHPSGEFLACLFLSTFCLLDGP